MVCTLHEVPPSEILATTTQDWMDTDILQQRHFVLFASNNVNEYTGDATILSLVCGLGNLLAQSQFHAFRKWTFSAKDVISPNSASSSA